MESNTVANSFGVSTATSKFVVVSKIFTDVNSKPIEASSKTSFHTQMIPDYVAKFVDREDNSPGAGHDSLDPSPMTFQKLSK